MCNKNLSILLVVTALCKDKQSYERLRLRLGLTLIGQQTMYPHSSYNALFLLMLANFLMNGSYCYSLMINEIVTWNTDPLYSTYSIYCHIFLKFIRLAEKN